jgi:hypothetical protein
LQPLCPARGAGALARGPALGETLLLWPAWFFMAAGFGGGGTRSLARMFAAQGRIASRVRSVQYLGTTPLLEFDANWARYQFAATKSRHEGVFRITYANGQQQVVLADRFIPGSRRILEANTVTWAKCSTRRVRPTSSARPTTTSI